MVFPYGEGSLFFHPTIEVGGELLERLSQNFRLGLLCQPLWGKHRFIESASHANAGREGPQIGPWQKLHPDPGWSAR